MYKRQKLRDIGRKLASRYCSYIVTLTNSDKDLWIKGLGAIRSEIFPIVNPTSYENIENTPSLDYKKVLSIGRLTHVKGFDLLIEAWSGVCESNKDWTLQIVGDGEEEEDLKRQAKTLSIADRIEFIPATRDIGKYYKTSSFYCLSSRFEGLPMVLLEAQAFSLPLVAFNCTTGPSEIITNSSNGYICNVNDTQELKKALIDMINSNQQDFEDMCYSSKINSKNYTVDKVIEKWNNIISVSYTHLTLPTTPYV